MNVLEELYSYFLLGYFLDLLDELNAHENPKLISSISMA